MTRPAPRPSPRPSTRPRPVPRAAGEPLADAPDTTTPEPTAPEPTAAPRPTRLERRRAAETNRRAGRRRGTLVAVGGVLLVIVAIVAAVTVLRRNLDQPAPAATPTGRTASGAVLADEAAAQGFVAGATSDIGAVSSYDYRDLDTALSAGLAVTTGAYRTAYRDSITGTLGAAARRDKLVQTFELVRAGIGAVSTDGTTAKVLIFGEQTLTSGADGGASRVTATTLTATVVRRGDSYLISKLESGTNAGLPPSSPQLPVAAEAGRQQVIDLLTYRRADFDTDYQRALAGAVDPLRTTITTGAAATRTALRTGKYDLSGDVTAVAVESASGTSLVLLVAATGYRVADDGTRTVDNDARVEVTVVRVDGAWKVSDVQPVAA